MAKSFVGKYLDDINDGDDHEPNGVTYSHVGNPNQTANSQINLDSYLSESDGHYALEADNDDESANLTGDQLKGRLKIYFRRKTNANQS